MNIDDIDKEIARAARSLSQSVNPIESVEWGTHLRELLATRREALQLKPKPAAHLLAMSQSETELLGRAMSNAAVEVNDANLLTALLLVKRLWIKLNED